MKRNVWGKKYVCDVNCSLTFICNSVEQFFRAGIRCLKDQQKKNMLHFRRVIDFKRHGGIFIHTHICMCILEKQIR